MLPAYQRRLIANLSSPTSPVISSVSKKETNGIPKNPPLSQQLQRKPNTKHVQRTSTPSKPEKNVHKSSHSKSLMKRRSIFEKSKSNNNTENDYDTWKRNRLNNGSQQPKSQHTWKPARLQRQNCVLDLYQNLKEKNNAKCATSKTVAANRAEEMRKMKEAMKKRELLLNNIDCPSPCETIDKKSVPALNEQSNSQWKKYVIVVDKQERTNSRNNSLSSHTSISSSTSVSSHPSILSHTSDREKNRLKLPNDKNMDSTPSTPKKTIRRLSFEIKKLRCSTAEKVASERAKEIRKMREAIAKREKMLEENVSKSRKSITNATGEMVASNKAAEMREMREAMKKRELALEETNQHSSPIVDNLDPEPKLLENGNNQWLKHVIILDKSKTKSSDTSAKCKIYDENTGSNLKKNEAEGMKKKEEIQFTGIMLKKEKHQKPRKVSNEDPEPIPFHKITNLQSKKRSGNSVPDEPKKMHPILSRISYGFDENEDPICSTAKKIAADKEEEMRKMKDAMIKRAVALEQECLQRRQDSQKAPFFERCSTAKLIAAQREEETRDMREMLRKREMSIEKMNQPKHECSSTIDQHEPELSFKRSNSQWEKHVLCTASPVKEDINIISDIKNTKLNIISEEDINGDGLAQMTAEEKRLAKHMPF